jgi:hypothetical protein
MAATTDLEKTRYKQSSGVEAMTSATLEHKSACIGTEGEKTLGAWQKNG